ncbi:MAG: S9 family peptidase [Ignavibacteriae bacterium HGW-Ignavibacteriae-1]|nr:MAG: S9 family peptidase [Ignavibacteriae bacterium HGW-Ignavibacteriae-1]
MNKSYLVTVLMLVSCIMSCEKQESEQVKPNENLIRFQDRIIDLAPYLEGFPFSNINIDYESGIIFFFKDGASKQLQYLDFVEKVDFWAGKTVSDVDFSKRNVFDLSYNKVDSCFYWNGDERNDEVLNIYRMHINSGKIEKLTDVPYIFGFNYDDTKTKIIYVARLGTKEDRLSEVRILDLTTGKEKILFRDNTEMLFTWGKPLQSKDGKTLIVTANKNGDRSYGNLLLLDLEKRATKVITNETMKRKTPVIFQKWYSDNEFLYSSNETDINNIFKYNILTNETIQLTNLDANVSSFDYVEIGDKKLLALTSSNPINTNIMLINPKDGQILNTQVTDVNHLIIDAKANKIMSTGSSAATKFIMSEISVSEDSFNFDVKYDLPNELKEKIYHADIEKIDYPTFDVDEKTGKQRLIHAYLYKPKNPLPKDKQIVLIQSFYGGYNNFVYRNHLLAEAGITVLSPAPRGSDGWGFDFKAMNDKDLGGNEILDLIYAAKYVNETMEIPPNRIGTFGGSHGGYAVMRLLTFPGEVNGYKANFDWGFGMSDAGFSDIIHFYKTCNIPDWVLLEAGDPATEEEKLKDRSPLYHADLLRGKLLLTHGENDSRVPTEGSIWMADSLKKYGKDFELVLFEGQGHDIKGLENNITYFKTWFNFLNKIGD